jgi:hypothetical protein
MNYAKLISKLLKATKGDDEALVKLFAGEEVARGAGEATTRLTPELATKTRVLEDLAAEDLAARPIPRRATGREAAVHTGTYSMPVDLKHDLAAALESEADAGRTARAVERIADRDFGRARSANRVVREQELRDMGLSREQRAALARLAEARGDEVEGSKLRAALVRSGLDEDEVAELVAKLSGVLD